MGVPIWENLQSFLWNSKGADSVWVYTHNSVEEKENVSNYNWKTGDFWTQILWQNILTSDKKAVKTEERMWYLCYD